MSSWIWFDRIHRIIDCRSIVPGQNGLAENHWRLFPSRGHDPFARFGSSARRFLDARSRRSFRVRYLALGSEGVTDGFFCYFVHWSKILKILNRCNLSFPPEVCLGLGDPIESPSPLLSLAAGCTFLNPKKNQTLDRKPTHRRVIFKTLKCALRNYLTVKLLLMSGDQPARVRGEVRPTPSRVHLRSERPGGTERNFTGAVEGRTC